MANRDLLEVFDAPEIPILAHGPEIEARDPKRLRADSRIPAIEATEVEVGRAVGQPTRLDQIEVINQKQENVAIEGATRRRR